MIRRFWRRLRSRPWHVTVRENWYRDVWLVIVSIICVVAVFRATDALSNVEKERVDSFIVQCRIGNERHDETLRQLRNETNEQERQHPKLRPASELGYARAVILIDAIIPRVKNCNAEARHRVFIRKAR